MLNPFICGSFNHHQETEYEEHLPCSNNNSPRRSKKHHHNPNKNPYSSRGLDKFSALLAQLDEKKQQIYSQMDAQDISLVRFAYSKTNDFVPIVVKLKDRNQNLKHLENPQKNENHKNNVFKVSNEEKKHDPRLSEENRGDSDKKTEKQGIQKQRMFSCSWCLEFFSPCNWKRPSGYLPLILILILCFLTVFGRSFTVMCTCLGWYLVPTLQELKKSSKISMKKMKQQPQRRFLSENRRSFNPRNFKNDNKSPPKLRHQKSSLK